MKLLQTVLFLMCVLKLAATRALNGPSSFNVSTPAEELVQYYAHEFGLLAQETCTKIKYITDEILKDAVVQKTSTPLMQTLKKNLTEFQQYYTYFRRLGLNEGLMSDFSNMMKTFYYPSPYANNNDFRYIQQLLKQLGYNDIRDKLRLKFRTFLDEKFLIKFSELQDEIVNKSQTRAHDLHVLRWIDLLKECQDYECFLIDFDAFALNEKPWNRFFHNLIQDIVKALIVNADKTTVFARAVLNDPRLSQLSAPLKQQLIKNLQDITKIQQNVTALEYILVLQSIYYFVLFKFDDYASISLKERQLITTIFKDNGYEELIFSHNEEKPAHSDYIKQFEDRKAKFSPENLAQQKSLLEAVDRLISASSPQAKEEASKNFDKVLINSKFF